MTQQEIFSKIVIHLRKQNAKSTSSDGRCMYRNPEGLKCAVGCLIPDDEYKAIYEGFSVSLLTDFLYTANSNFSILKLFKEHRDLLWAMQGIHDGNSIHEWEKCFAETAIALELELPR